MSAHLREPSTGSGGGDVGVGAAFVFTQDVASALWLVGHNLAMFPNVSVVDTLDRLVDADVEYVDENNLTIAFGRPATGKAYLS